MSKTVPCNSIEYTKKDGQLIKYLLDLAVLYAQALSEIKDIAKDSKEAMYRFIRRNSAFGRDFKYGVLSPDSVVRMFPTGKVKWQD